MTAPHPKTMKLVINIDTDARQAEIQPKEASVGAYDLSVLDSLFHQLILSIYEDMKLRDSLQSSKPIPYNS